MHDLDAQWALGIHWGTFKLTDEPRHDPLRQLDAALAAQDVAPGRFRAIHPGDAIDIPPRARPAVILPRRPAAPPGRQIRPFAKSLPERASAGASVRFS
jgi:hypothetical protein